MAALRKNTEENIDLNWIPTFFHPKKGQTTVLLTDLIYQRRFFEFA